MIKDLEIAIAKVRALPEEKQREAAELLEELVATDVPYELSAVERAAIEAALERANRGEFARDDDVAALWVKWER